MRGRWLIGAATAAALASGTGAAPPPDPKAERANRLHAIEALGWVRGPAQVPLPGNATMALPAGDMYLPEADTKRFLTLTGNLSEDGLVTVAAKDLGWFSIFGFNDVGYVKDDEAIEPDKLMTSLQESQTKGNEERQAKGLGTLTIAGWTVPPHYDRASHNLEWGTRLVSPDGENVNYTTRLLGRRGVTSATLVADTATLPAELGQFRTALAGFHYAPADRYEAYARGDKVAEYGLAALITGGAAAAVLKAGAAKGLWALLVPFWKLILGGAAAIGLWFRRLVARLRGRTDGDAA